MRALVGAAFLLVSANALAGNGAPAETLFQQGLKAMDEGRFAEACPKLEESLRLDPAAGTVLNLAACEEKLGKIASAWEHFHHALELLPAEDARRAIAEAKVKELERRVPKLAVRVVPAMPAGAHVVRDGTTLGNASLSVPFPVDPGLHEISMVGEGGERRAKITVDIAESESRIVVLEAGGGHVADGRKSASPRILPLVTGGAAIAALTLGITTGLLALDRNGTMNDHCTGDRACDPVGLDAGSSGRTFANVSTVSLITAGVLIAATTYLVVWGR